MKKASLLAPGHVQLLLGSVAAGLLLSLCPGSRVEAASGNPSYPWHKQIVTTVFWIGQGRTPISAATNIASAWDVHWTRNYGGLDDPSRRVGFLPRRFAATLNPFYVALPFNDVAYPDLARRWVPWYREPSRGNRYVSQCKGRWVEIRHKGKVAYAQWEDVGPLRADFPSYVFGSDRPQMYNGAGLDVAPAVRDLLGLHGLDLTDWRFVSEGDVPSGPWMKYGEQAILLRAILNEERKAAAESSRLFAPALFPAGR